MRTSALALAFVVAGCAPAAYLEPVDVETATLRIENQGPAIFGYQLEADTYENAAACSGRLRVASARALPRGVAHTVHVVASADFTLTLRGTGGGASRGDACALAGTFTPSAGERYVGLEATTPQSSLHDLGQRLLVVDDEGPELTVCSGHGTKCKRGVLKLSRL